MENIPATTLSILFGTTILSLLIFMILLIVHYTVKPIFPFLDTAPVETNVNQTVHLDKISSLQPANSAITFSNIPIFQYINFTLGFDCYLSGAFTPTDIPHVLLYYNTGVVDVPLHIKEYRGTNDVVPLLLTEDTTDLISSFPQSNFITYVDPVKNDLRIGIFTKEISGPNTNRKWLELLPPIENIPIRKPFQMTLVITNRFIEVYMNKSLIQTYRYKYDIVPTPPPRANLYSPIDTSIKIANVMYADVSLTSIQVRNLSPTLTLSSVFV